MAAIKEKEGKICWGGKVAAPCLLPHPLKLGAGFMGESPIQNGPHHFFADDPRVSEKAQAREKLDLASPQADLSSPGKQVFTPLAKGVLSLVFRF